MVSHLPRKKKEDKRKKGHHGGHHHHHPQVVKVKLAVAGTGKVRTYIFSVSSSTSKPCAYLTALNEETCRRHLEAVVLQPEGPISDFGRGRAVAMAPQGSQA